MNTSKRLKSLLIKAGLKPDEASLYLFVSENPGCSIADVYKRVGISKSSAYRAFESLRSLDLLNTDAEAWKTNLSAISLTGLIRKLEGQQRNRQRLISDLKTFNNVSRIAGNSKISGIESLEGEAVYQKYLDLSQMAFDTDLVYGNWEPFNNRGSLVSLEKNFINNRVKNGGNCLLVLTGDGPNTKEITDYDCDENRTTKFRKPNYDKKPVWINAFEGNNFVYIWNLDDTGNINATFIDSKPVSEFYKEFIYSQSA